MILGKVWVHLFVSKCTLLKQVVCEQPYDYINYY